MQPVSFFRGPKKRIKEVGATTSVEPMAGIEPATDGLRNRCSTTELRWQKDELTLPVRSQIVKVGFSQPTRFHLFQP